MLRSERIPIIRMKGIFVVSIQTSLDDARVSRLKEDVAATIARQGGRGLILDVAGIDVMDSYFTRAIHDLARIARLMGVPTVLSGIDPSIAVTLVEMGLGMEGVKTHRDLEKAYEYLLQVQEEEAHSGPLARADGRRIPKGTDEALSSRNVL